MKAFRQKMRVRVGVHTAKVCLGICLLSAPILVCWGPAMDGAKFLMLKAEVNTVCVSSECFSGIGSELQQTIPAAEYSVEENGGPKRFLSVKVENPLAPFF